MVACELCKYKNLNQLVTIWKEKFYRTETRFTLDIFFREHVGEDVKCCDIVLKSCDIIHDNGGEMGS